MKFGLALGLLGVAASLMAERPNKYFDVDLGLRSDLLSWSIRGEGDVNILSELTWSDVTILQLQFEGAVPLFGGFFARANAAFGSVLHGKNQDSDYDGPNRTLEFSRSNNGTGGATVDLSLALGYELFPSCSIWQISPLLGYSYNKQHFNMVDGHQTIPFNAPFPNLHSYYEAIWNGPWIGLNVTYTGFSRYTLFGELQGHYPNYSGKGFWNLREEFAQPFRHYATATGIDFSLGSIYRLSSHWTVDLILDYQWWHTGTGDDQTFFRTEEPGLVLLFHSPFNGARHRSVSLSIGTEFCY